MKKKIVPIVSLLLAIFFGYSLTQNDQKLLESIIGTTENTATTAVATNKTDGLFEVVKIADGDTITILMDGDNEKIRFIGIDTPEVGNSTKESDCYGDEAKSEMERLLEGHMIKLEFDETQGERDRYDRLLAYVYLDDGLFLNQHMIENGFAKEYTYKYKYKYSDDFRRAEDNAIFKKAGIWNPEICQQELLQKDE